MRTSYQVEFGVRAQDALQSMETQQSYLIMSWIKKNLVNCSNPRHDGKGLKDKDPSKWLYKIGDYRLISHIEAETITVLALQIGHRKNSE